MRGVEGLITPVIKPPCLKVVSLGPAGGHFAGDGQASPIHSALVAFDGVHLTLGFVVDIIPSPYGIPCNHFLG